MEDDKFKNELDELIGMLKVLRLIKDQKQSRVFKAEMRVQLSRTMRF